MKLNGLLVENFKSYEGMTRIPLSNLSVLLGANSSGKSTAMQTLLTLKQTAECNSPEIDLLLSGKYVTLGDFEDVINDLEKDFFSIGVSVTGDEYTEDYDDNKVTDIVWKFSRSVDKDIILDEIVFSISNAEMKLIRDENYVYNIFINKKDTSLSVKVNNLLSNRLYVNYDSEFNSLFYDFLREILVCLYSDKKQSHLERKKFVSLKTVEAFYFELMRRGEVKDNEKKDEEYRKQIQTLVNRIMSDINEYCEYQFEYYSNFDGMPQNLKETILFHALYKNEAIETVEKVLEKYETILKIEKSNNNRVLRDESDDFNIERIYSLGSEEKGINPECDIISDAFRIYDRLFSEILNNIFYLGPIREKPQGLYNVGFERIPKYVGTSGAFFASVLLRENRKKEYILPNEVKEEMTLLEALDEWTSHLNVASQIEVEKKNSFGFSVSISNTQRRKSDIMNVGIGTSQVLPVLITGLLSEEGEYLLFEQPELHLHPFSQSRLADFFIELVRNGRKIVVETHSEYFILRLRYHVLKNNINEKDIIVNFFQNKGGTKISQSEISGYGDLHYPEDFRDETQKLLDDLMNAALEKREQ